MNLNKKASLVKNYNQKFLLKKLFPDEELEELGPYTLPRGSKGFFPGTSPDPLLIQGEFRGDFHFLAPIARHTLQTARNLFLDEINADEDAETEAMKCLLFTAILICQMAQKEERPEFLEEQPEGYFDNIYLLKAVGKIRNDSTKTKELRCKMRIMMLTVFAIAKVAQFVTANIRRDDNLPTNWYFNKPHDEQGGLTKIFFGRDYRTQSFTALMEAQLAVQHALIINHGYEIDDLRSENKKYINQLEKNTAGRKLGPAAAAKTNKGKEETRMETVIKAVKDLDENGPGEEMSHAAVARWLINQNKKLAMDYKPEVLAKKVSKARKTIKNESE